MNRIDLLTQANSPDQILKSRITSHGIIKRIYLEGREDTGLLPIRCLQAG